MVERHESNNYSRQSTKKDFEQLYNSSGLECALSSINLVNGPFASFQWSLDRIDNSQGYVVGNVRIVALEFNVYPTYTPAILHEYASRSLSDITRSSQELESIKSCEIFKQKAFDLLRSAIGHVCVMQNAETAINRREKIENGSLMTLQLNDICLMFMNQKGKCYYSDISIYC